jgi:hypothetical protein
MIFWINRDKWDVINHVRTTGNIPFNGKIVMPSGFVTGHSHFYVMKVREM